MKDLVKLQHGEFVSLSKVETALKMSPLVDQICIHAHGSQSWCIALVVPNQKMLTEVAAKMGIKDKSYEELCAMDKMSKEVLKQLADVGKKGEKLHILIDWPGPVARSRGPEFNPGPLPYFRGDWSWNIFYGHSRPFCWFTKAWCQLQAKVWAQSTT